MKISAVKCKKCLDIIYSRCGHDFHWCSCSTVAIDGGREMTRVVGEPEDYEHIEIDVEVTDREMWDDWDKDINRLGWIKK